MALQQAARKQGPMPTIEDQAATERKRNSLLKDITRFNTEAVRYLGPEPVAEIPGTILYGDNTFEADWDIHPDYAEQEAAENDVATRLIALPSAIVNPERFPEILAFCTQELELRKGQANDVLTSIREIVGQLSFQWSKGVRLAPDKARATRARKSIEKIHRKLALESKSYQQIRSAMQRLGLPEAELQSVYRPLTPADISVSKAVKGPNERGESQTQLSWIWTTMHGLPGDRNYLTECTFTILLPVPADH